MRHSRPRLIGIWNYSVPSIVQILLHCEDKNVLGTFNRFLWSFKTISQSQLKRGCHKTRKKKDRQKETWASMVQTTGNLEVGREMEDGVRMTYFRQKRNNSLFLLTIKESGRKIMFDSYIVGYGNWKMSNQPRPIQTEKFPYLQLQFITQLLASPQDNSMCADLIY